MTATDDEYDGFVRDGFLLRHCVFTRAEIDALRAEADEILALLINSSLANHRTSGRLDVRECADGRHVVRKVQPVVDLSLAFARLAEDPRVVSPLHRFVSSHPELMEEKLIYKQPLAKPIPGIAVRQAEARFHAHNDWAYHRAHGYPPTIVNVAVCLDDCVADAGPLHVWPGTHTSFIWHDAVDQSHKVPAERLEGREELDLIVEAGALIFFHGLLIHSSSANRTSGPRRLLILSYHPADDGVSFDARNGATRIREAPYEWQYARMKLSGAFSDQFSLRRP